MPVWLTLGARDFLRCATSGVTIVLGALVTGCLTPVTAPPGYVVVASKPPDPYGLTPYATPGPYGSPSYDFAILDNHIFAATETGLYRSADLSGPWTLAGIEEPVLSLAAIGPSLFAHRGFFRRFVDENKNLDWMSFFQDSLRRSDNLGGDWASVFPGRFTSVFDFRGRLLAFDRNLGTMRLSDEQGIRWESVSLPQLLESMSQPSSAVTEPIIVGPIETVEVTEASCPSSSDEGLFVVGRLWFCWNQRSEVLRRSVDAGEHWGPTRGDFENRVIQNIVAVDKTLYMGTSRGYLQSTDSGETWRAGAQALDNEVVHNFAKFSGLLLAATSAGVLASGDDGKTWEERNWGILAAPGVSLFVSGNFHFVSTGSEVHRSDSLGASWRRLDSLPEGPRMAQGFARTGEALFVGLESGLFRSYDDGESWAPVGGGWFADVQVLVSAEDLVVSVDRSNRVFMSADEGESWVARGRPSTPVRSIVGAAGTFFAGGEDGIFVSGGSSGWQQTWADDSVRTLATADATVFAGTVDGELLRFDPTTGVDIWQSVPAHGLSGGVNDLWIEAGALSVLVAGTDDGLFWSRDGGATFVQVMDDRFTAVYSLDHTRGHLFIGTDKGFFYVVDRIPRPPGLVRWAVEYSWVLLGSLAVLLVAAVSYPAINKKVRRIRAEKLRLQRMEMEVDVARRRMEKLMLLPRGPFERPGIRLAHRSQRATTMSGDFYNVIPRGDGSLGIYMVDVEGHGLAAAHQAQDVMRVLSRSDLEWGSGSAHEELERADRLISDELSEQDLAVTMNFTEIDPEAKRIRFANAGMPFALLFRPGRAHPQPLQAAGVYVGGGYSRHAIQPEQAEVETQDGDVLLLFSDGVIEALDERRRTFGQQGIIAAVSCAGLDDPERIADEILKSTARHAGTEVPEDDQALLVVCIGEAGNGAERSRTRTLVCTSETNSRMEFQLVNAADTAEVASTELYRGIIEWLQARGVSEKQRHRIWNAVWEGLANAIVHGSHRGDSIGVKVYSVGKGVWEVELRQPKAWPEWDDVLGQERAKELHVSSEPVMGGTVVMLRLASQIVCSRDGRRITMRFHPEGYEHHA